MAKRHRCRAIPPPPYLLEDGLNDSKRREA
jgi:hypothetical protein